MAKYKLKDLSLSKLEYGSGAAACGFDGNARYVRITDITDLICQNRSNCRQDIFVPQ